MILQYHIYINMYIYIIIIVIIISIIIIIIIIHDHNIKICFLNYPALVFPYSEEFCVELHRNSWEANFHIDAFHIFDPNSTPPICCSQILAALRCAFVTLGEAKKKPHEFKEIGSEFQALLEEKQLLWSF